MIRFFHGRMADQRYYGLALGHWTLFCLWIAPGMLPRVRGPSRSFECFDN